MVTCGGDQDAREPALMSRGKGIPNADTHRIGGYLERRVAWLVFVWVFPVVVMWIGFWFVGVYYLATGGGVFFPTLAVLFYLTLMVIHDHVTPDDVAWW